MLNKRSREAFERGEARRRIEARSTLTLSTTVSKMTSFPSCQMNLEPVVFDVGDSEIDTSTRARRCYNAVEFSSEDEDFDFQNA